MLNVKFSELSIKTLLGPILKSLLTLLVNTWQGNWVNANKKGEMFEALLVCDTLSQLIFGNWSQKIRL